MVRLDIMSRRGRKSVHIFVENTRVREYNKKWCIVCFAEEIVFCLQIF